MDTLLSDALESLLADACTPDAVRQIEAGGSPAALWRQIADSGFADALVPEAAGGAGLALPDVAGVLETCGRHLLPLPLAETMWARAALARAGVAAPAGAIALAVLQRTGAGTLRADTVRLGRAAQAVLARDGQGWRLLSADQARIEEAGYALDATLTWAAADAGIAVALPPAVTVDTVQAALIAPQIAGAVSSVLQRSLQYANERVQFGRPIAKFQAIQHQLAVMAEHVYAARMAAQIGCQASGLAPDPLRVAVAKGRTSEAALAVAELAHAIHGAIGFTAEFDLQLFTRRLHVWRQAAGAESYWHRLAGHQLVRRHTGPALDLVRRASESGTTL